MKELDVDGINVILVNVSVSNHMDESTGSQTGDMGEHVDERTIGRDVEGDAKKEIAGSLIELAIEKRFVSNRELGHDVTRRKGHLFEIRDVPCRKKDSSRVWIVPEETNNLCELIDALTRVIGRVRDVFRAPVSPLKAVNRAQITFLVRVETSPVEKLSASVGVPKVNVSLVQIRDRCRSRDEPQKLSDDLIDENLFCCDHGKSLFCFDLIAKTPTISPSLDCRLSIVDCGVSSG